MKKFVGAGLVFLMLWGQASAVSTEGLIGYWPLKPTTPLRIEWRAENADAGTWRTGYSWNSSNRNASVVTLPDGDQVWEVTGNKYAFSSALIPVDPSKTYRLTGRFRSTGSVDSKLYFGYTPHEKDGTYISSVGVFFKGNPVTISSFNDTTITTGDAVSGWNTGGSYSSQILGFYYDGDTSDKRPDYVMYSSGLGTNRGAYDTAIGNTISLTTPIPATQAAKIIPGTTVVQNYYNGSGSYLYAAASSKYPPKNIWTTYTADSTGDSWTQSGSKNFRPRTRYVRIMMLLNYAQDSNSTIQFDDIVLEEVQGDEGSTDGSFLARDETPIRTLATTDRHHGAVYGATFTDGINGEPRGAMNFDGTNNILLPADIGYSDEVSAFSWFKAGGTPPGDYHVIFGGAGLEISITPSGQLRTGVNTTTRYVSNHGTGLLDGNWHHVGFTFKNEVKKAYIDGILVGTDSVPGTLNPIVSDRRMGEFGTANYFLNGSIADARVYSRALSASEVAELASSGSSFVGTSKISTINSGNSAEEGRLYYNFETKKFWKGLANGTVTQTTTPATHKTSAQITALDGSAQDGYFYYDTDERRFYVGQPDGSLHTLTD